VEVSELHAGAKYNTNDVFLETDPGYICHICRADDLIVHSSGEKTNPVPLEVLLKKECAAAVARLCLIGTNKPRPVLIVELSDEGASDPNTTAFTLYTAINATNESAPPYSRIEWKQCLVVVPGEHPTLPVSGKGNVQRSMTEKRFVPDMDLVFQAGQAAAAADKADDIPVVLKQAAIDAYSAAASLANRLLGREVNAHALKEPLMAGNGYPPVLSSVEVKGADEPATCAHNWIDAHLPDEERAQDEAAAGFDSLDFAQMMSGVRSPADAMRGHMYWFLMFCVVTRHIVHKYQQHATVLSRAGMAPASLAGIHNVFGTFAIPGFIALVGWRDSIVPPRTMTHLKRQILLPLMIVLLMEFGVPLVLRAIYPRIGYDATAVRNQALLPYFASWLLLMITICRALLMLTNALRVPRTAVAALAVAVHFSCAFMECPWPLTRYGRHFNTEGMVRPVLSAYWIYYTLLPMVLPSSFLTDVPPSFRVKRVALPIVSAVFVVAVGWWALDNFNTEFSCGADRRRYGCDPADWSYKKTHLSLGAYLVSDECAGFTLFDLWEDVWHNALSFAMIIAVGHLMPKKATIFSAIGECSLVCLVVHMCLWAGLWPMVWEVVGAAGKVSGFLLPLITLLGCALMIQCACSFHVTVSEPLFSVGGFEVRVPTIAPPSFKLFHACWYLILILKLSVASGVLSSAAVQLDEVAPPPASVEETARALLYQIWSDNVA